MPPRRTRAAAVVFALLVVATLGAFAYAQRRKRDPLIVDRTELGRTSAHAFTPNGDCVKDTIRIKFRTTTSNDATVQVTTPDGEVVDTLADGEFLKRYRYQVFAWNGASSNGGASPPGRYKIRIHLEDEGRTVELPGSIHLHGAPRKDNGRACHTFAKPEGHEG